MTTPSATKGWQLSCCTLLRQEKLCNTNLRPSHRTRSRRAYVNVRLPTLYSVASTYPAALFRFCLPMRSACAHSICASLVRGVFSLVIRGSSSCGTGAFSKFDSSMRTFLTIQTRLAGFLVCIQKIGALSNVWCMNAGTTQVCNTVYNCDAGASPKHLVSQYAAVYTLLNVLVFETKP